MLMGPTHEPINPWNDFYRMVVAAQQAVCKEPP